LDFAHARYYSSAVGRFTSVDDFLNDTKVIAPSSWNLYVYVRNNPLRYVDSTGQEVEDTNLTQEQRDKLIADFKKKTGFKVVDFKDGKLYVDRKAGFEGGSEKARKQLLDAIDSSTVFRLTGVNKANASATGFSETRDTVAFAKIQNTPGIGPGGVKTYRIFIDFEDIDNVTGDKEALESMSIGMQVFHEFTHKLYGDVSDYPSNNSDDPGPNERMYVNPIREELGLPTRVQYTPRVGKADGDNRYLYFRMKDGSIKIATWKESVVKGDNF